VGHATDLHPHEHTASTALDTMLLHPALKKAPVLTPRKSQVHFTSLIVSACSIPATVSNKSLTSVTGEGKI